MYYILHLFCKYHYSAPEKAKEALKEAIDILKLSDDKSLQIGSYDRHEDFLISNNDIDGLKKALDFTLPDSIKVKVLNQLEVF